MKIWKSRVVLVLGALVLGCASDKTPQAPQVPVPPIAQSDEELIQHLAQAYRTMDYDWYVSLLADPDRDPRLPEFWFILDGPGSQKWNHEEEGRIHQRMFEPDKTPAGQTPVRAEYKLTSISITLTNAGGFAEQSDFYMSPSNPDGLSPTEWSVTGAIYATNVLFDTQGSLDYQINGRAFFVVLEDLTRNPGDLGKFQLLAWHDLGVGYKSSQDDRSWAAVKRLYQ